MSAHLFHHFDFVSCEFHS